jgi:hypothetical protein
MKVSFLRTNRKKGVFQGDEALRELNPGKKAQVSSAAFYIAMGKAWLWVERFRFVSWPLSH